MKRVLVHICCAPDALYFLERLREDYPNSELIGFFYDPNIHPYEEYRLRYQETERACRQLGIKLIEGEYDLENWLMSVKGLEEEPERGERCSVCFDFRLERSARLARELGCEAMTTTLLMSPKKSFHQLSESGKRVSQRYGVSFLPLNYRKGGGTQEMFRLTKEKEIYQQDYCGCIYGLFKQKGEDSLWDLTGFGGRRPGSKEETLFIKRVRTSAESLALPVREYEFPFLGWFPLEGGVWIGGEALPSIVKPFSAPIRGKVRADVERIEGNTLYLNKQYVKLVLLEELRDLPLEEIPPTTNPTFYVPRDCKDRLLSSRVEASLRTEIRHQTSRVLFIGREEAEEMIGIPADTLQDGRGIGEEEILSYIEDRREEIAKGSLGILLLGAHSLGRPGQRYFEELTGRRLSRVLPYP